jgi:hypothetical protein
MAKHRYNMMNQSKYFTKAPTNIKQEKRKAEDHLDDSKNAISKR